MASCDGGLLGCPGRPWRWLLRRPGRIPGTSLRGPGSSWRVPGGQDNVSDGSGVFEEDIWRGPGRPFFSFWGGEFAHGIMKYWYFSFWVVFWQLRWMVSLVIVFVHFLVIGFAKQWGEYTIKTNWFLTILKAVCSRLCEKKVTKTWFREVNFEPLDHQFWWKSLSFFNNFAFQQQVCFWCGFWHWWIISKSEMSILART